MPDRTPTEIAQEVYSNPNEFTLTRMQTEVEDFTYFKQVAAVYWIEQSTGMP